MAFRWIIRWLCGYMGWENRRPLPACIYNDIRTRYQTKFLAFRGFSPHFRDTCCFDPHDFSNDNSSCSSFRAIIRSSRKVTAIFRTIIRSSQKFDLLFINRPRAFLKYSSLTEIPKWPFQLLARKKPLICWVASQLDEMLAMKLTWLFPKER